jgi:hypothetical protein
MKSRGRYRLLSITSVTTLSGRPGSTLARASWLT